MKDHKEWIEQRLGKSVHAVALELGEDPSNFAKKVRRGLTTDHIIQIARAYEVPVVQALQETGIIGDDELEPESPERIAEAISYLAKKLAAKAQEERKKGWQKKKKSSVIPFSGTSLTGGTYIDGEYSEDIDNEMPEDAVAYSHDEIGGSLDDLDP